MPSLDLFDSSAHPDGWHDVRAPGGYEWWYFDAEEAATDTQVVAIFMQGFIFHPGYLRAFGKYLRRPTRTSPPMPGDYPSVYLCVYRGGRVAHQFFTEFRADQFAAQRDDVDVAIGPNRLRREGGDYVLSLSGTPWTLTSRGPRTHVDRSLSAELRFTPTIDHPPIERPFLSREMTGAVHNWTIAAPRCAVRGMIRVDADTIPFAGHGYHDHNYGTVPIGDGIRRWTWGRAMFDGGRVMTFHHAEPRDAGRSPETHLVQVDARGVAEHPSREVMLGPSLTCKPAMMLRYPASIDFGGALRLTEPRVVDPTPFYLRLQYEAESFGERSTAFCEIAYPHRVRWPILGRMIEMSFDKRPLKVRPQPSAESPDAG